MKVFLVVIAVWDMAYIGEQRTPLLVQEMPSMEACQAVGKAIVEMARSKVQCVSIPKAQ